MDIYRDGALYLYGYVGETYWDEGFTASQVLMALAEHGRDEDLTVHVNSGGGIVDEGVAIYNALAAHRGAVRVEVDSIAASSASVIVMAGDTIVMKAGSLLMIHDPANITFGTAADHAKIIEQLEAYATQMASIYSERSGKTADEARSDMKAEVWLTSAQAVEQGYADEAEASKAKVAASFDYRVYAKAPKNLKTTARKNGWTLTEAEPAKGATSTIAPHTKEPPMGDKPTGGDAPDNTAAIASAVKADRDRRKAIMSLDEAQGRMSLATYFADDTDDTVEKVKAALAAAPKASTEAATASDDAAALEARRLNGEGLSGNGRSNPGANMRVDIVANMQRRYGAKA